MDKKTQDFRRGEYLLTSESSKMDFEAVYRFLITTYWGHQITKESLRRAMNHSLCFGMFHEGEQIGFCRVFTDYCSVAYLFDVYVLAAHRGKGLATWMLEKVLIDDRIARVRRWLLVTRDAQRLYEKVGFRSLSEPERYMEKIHV